MINYYHFTSYKNLENICKNGLLPQKGERTRSAGDNRSAVFLSKGFKNTILMYTSILYHYNSYAGKHGEKAIEFYKNRIKQYEERAKQVPLDEEDIAEMEAINKTIEWIKPFTEYRSFSEYAEDGCYLSISEADDIIESEPTDCYTEKSIPPEKIRVVTIKNRKTGKVIDSREKVLAYFMSMTPMESITNTISNVVTIKLVEDLYRDRADDISYYDFDNFEMEEIPINLYIHKENSKDQDEER